MQPINISQQKWVKHCTKSEILGGMTNFSTKLRRGKKQYPDSIYPIIENYKQPKNILASAKNFLRKRKKDKFK